MLPLVSLSMKLPYRVIPRWPEPPSCLLLRLGARPAARDQPLDALLDVKAQLVVDFVLGASASADIEVEGAPDAWW